MKGGPRGTEVVQQSHDMRWDLPGGGGGKVRLMPAVFYDRTVNSGYFGLGNASRVVTNPDGSIGDRYQFRHEEASTRLNIRTPLGGPFSTMYGWQLRYVNPHAYPESRLAIDAATRDSDGRPLIRGSAARHRDAQRRRDLRHAQRRDLSRARRLSPRRAPSLGRDADIERRVLGGRQLHPPLVRAATADFVFAGRIIVDAMAGHPPFYDLSQGGAFDPNDLPGGAQGVRGVPNGRYSGLLKVVGNAELRRIHFGFRFLGSKFQVGTTTFVDAGRVWNDYTFTDPRDGTSIGIKYGVAEARSCSGTPPRCSGIDVAYSPDAPPRTLAFRSASTCKKA